MYLTPNVQLCLYSRSKKMSFYTQGLRRSEEGELYLLEGYSTVNFLCLKTALGLVLQIELLVLAQAVGIKLIQMFTV